MIEAGDILRDQAQAHIFQRNNNGPQPVEVVQETAVTPSLKKEPWRLYNRLFNIINALRYSPQALSDWWNDTRPGPILSEEEMIVHQQALDYALHAVGRGRNWKPQQTDASSNGQTQ